MAKKAEPTTDEPTQAEPEQEATVEDAATEAQRIADQADFETPLDVYRGLAWVQENLTHVGKNKETAGGGPKYKFRSIDHVIQALHPLLGKAGILIVPQVLEMMIDDHFWSKGAPKQRVEPVMTIKVRFRVIASDGSALPKSMCPVVWAQGIDSGDKASGKAMSYAYKSAISQLFSIPTDDPAMDNENRNEPAPNAQWGHGWDTKAQHDDFRSELIALMRKSKNRAGFDKLKAELTKLGILNDEGRPINPVEAKLMKQWQEVLTAFIADEPAAEKEPADEPPADKPKAKKEQKPPTDVQVLRVLRESTDPLDSTDIAELTGAKLPVVEVALVALSMTGLALAHEEDGAEPVWSAVSKDDEGESE